MTKIYTLSVPLKASVLDAFCALEGGFTDQFVYYDKQKPTRYLGLGRCVALSTLDDIEWYAEERSEENIEGPAEASAGERAESSIGKRAEKDGEERAAEGGERGVNEDAGKSTHLAPVFFSFNRFDDFNPHAADELMASFPRLRFMLPEVVLIENTRGSFLQINSLGPVYEGRVKRFIKLVEKAAPCEPCEIPVTAYAEEVPHKSEVAEEDEAPAATNEAPAATNEAPAATDGAFAATDASSQSTRPDWKSWERRVECAKGLIAEGRLDKLVLSRRKRVVAQRPFTSREVLVNLIKGEARGVVLMYRYADVVFCGCTPELLVRKQGVHVESMCLAGTCPLGATKEESDRLAASLYASTKNREEHDYVVKLVRGVLDRVCYDVDVPSEPRVLRLATLQHLYTPAQAKAPEGVSLASLADDLHPTPAVAGAPVGEAKMTLRFLEPYNRGFYAGACGVVDAEGDGEYSVALRTGVFDGESGWVYAGCGIVEESDAAAEYAETELKMETLLSAFCG